MAVERKKKLIEVTALNLLVNVNEAMLRFWRRDETPDIRLPSLFDRAFMVHHEAGVIPAEEIAIVTEESADG